MSIPVAYANHRIFERLIKVMRQELGTELATVQAAIHADLAAPAPAASAYFRTFSEQARKVVRNQGVAVLLWQQGASRYPRHNSGGMGVRKSIRQTDVDVFVLFEYAMAQGVPQDDEGINLTPEQEIFIRANIYNGAVVNTLYKYAEDRSDGGAAIHKIEQIGDDWELTYGDEFLISGVAQTTWTITQTVEIPTCRPLPTP